MLEKQKIILGNGKRIAISEIMQIQLKYGGKIILLYVGVSGDDAIRQCELLVGADSIEKFGLESVFASRCKTQLKQIQVDTVFHFLIPPGGLNVLEAGGSSQEGKLRF